MATKPIPPKPKASRNLRVEELAERLSSSLEARLAGKSPAERAEITRKLRALAVKTRGVSGKR